MPCRSLFAQSAWNNVTFTAGKFGSRRNLPRALLLGCSLVVGLYLLANLAYVVTLPLAGIQNAPQGRVATAVMQAALGPSGTIIMAVAIMISTFGCNNGLILAGARVYYAMARDGLFFKRVATVNAHNVPSIALVTQGLWAAFLVLPRTVTINQQTGTYTYGNVYTQLLEYIVSADLILCADGWSSNCDAKEGTGNRDHIVRLAIGCAVNHRPGGLFIVDSRISHLPLQGLDTC